MDWRTSTLNSHLSTAQRLLNRTFASQSLTGRSQQHGAQNDETFKDVEQAVCPEDNRSETKHAIMQEILTSLKEEASRLDDDGWMYDQPRCTFNPPCPLGPLAAMLLSQTPEWSDLEPLDMPPDNSAAVSIQYTPEYTDTFGLLHAAMQVGEKSARVLDLTEHCICLCKAHYTAWDYRFQCLEALDADMEQEWRVCSAMAESNAKNYQLWNHRRRCAMRMGPDNAPRELEFAAYFLQLDTKNYHIWAHRQALVLAFDLWDKELEYVESMLQDDLRNNSAFNQRAWLVTRRISLLIPPPANDPHTLKHALTNETEYINTILQVTPHNDSAWNYLGGLTTILSDAVIVSSAAFMPVSQQGRETCTNDDSAVVRAEQVLQCVQPSVREAIAEAVQSVDSAVFDIALGVLKTSPACVPARVGLLKQYVRMAKIARIGGHASACATAVESVKSLCSTLVVSDPIHAPWYRSLASGIA